MPIKYARYFKDNFWSKKRVEANVMISDIAELLKCKYSTAGSYLSGKSMPSEEDIKTLCDFFNVDIIEGTREFINAHKAYDAERKRTFRGTAKPPKKTKTTPINQVNIFEPVIDTSDAQETEEDNICIEPEKDYTPIIKMVYESRVLSFEAYNEFIDNLMLSGIEDAKKFIYNHVGYELFIKILKEFEKVE